jgi:hypothetical protein
VILKNPKNPEKDVIAIMEDTAQNQKAAITNPEGIAVEILIEAKTPLDIEKRGLARVPIVTVRREV